MDTVVSLDNIKNEWEYLVTMLGESRNLEQYVIEEYQLVYDKEFKLLGWEQK